MNVVDFVNCGPPEVLKVERREVPMLETDEVLIQVVATTVSVFDMSRRKYGKILNGRQPLLGMECSGRIVERGSSVIDHLIGDEVCALLEGGGYAEFVAVPSWRVIPVPKGVRLDVAASLPYTTSFVWHSLFRVGKLMDKCSILVHNAAEELGQLAIQLAKLHGCTVFATGKFPGEMEYSRYIGADFCIKYDEDFVDCVLEKTKGSGIDFIFDAVGYRVADNLKILSRGGTLVIAQHYDVSKVRLDFGLLEKMQIKLIGIYFSSVPPEETQQILKEIVSEVWPSFERGELVPRVHERRYQFFEASAAHRYNQTCFGGKVLIVPTKPII